MRTTGPSGPERAQQNVQEAVPPLQAAAVQHHEVPAGDPEGAERPVRGREEEPPGNGEARNQTARVAREDPVAGVEPERAVAQKQEPDEQPELLQEPLRQGPRPDVRAEERDPGEGRREAEDERVRKALEEAEEKPEELAGLRRLAGRRLVRVGGHFVDQRDAARAGGGPEVHSVRRGRRRGERGRG